MAAALHGGRPSLISRGTLSGGDRRISKIKSLCQNPPSMSLEAGLAPEGTPVGGQKTRRKTREADLSTEQAGAQAPSRFPRPDGHQGRSHGDCQATRAWPQAAERLSWTWTWTPAIAMERLRQRADFLAAAQGAKVATAGFVLQARERAAGGPIRVGFTVSKKVGNAVERNRVRRRLREIVRLTAAARLRSGHDYVLVGRRSALSLPFERMTQDFDQALRRLRAPK